MGTFSYQSLPRAVVVRMRTAVVALGSKAVRASLPCRCACSEKAEDFFLDGVAWTSYRTAEKVR